MYRSAMRSASRPALSGFRGASLRAAPRRFASTASPVDKPRTWKGSALRWGLAAAAVYYYNTSPVFADDATSQILSPTPYSESDLPTVDALVEKKRTEVKEKRQEKSEKKKAEPAKSEPTERAEAQTDTPAQTTAILEGSEALEEEVGQEGAFNPETGEINWDCPCLGGMAHGPCGEEFKTAFSCFVHSEEDPKGMDCIDKFQGMQECFRQYPDIYGSELADSEAAEDEEDGTTDVPATDAATAKSTTPEAATTAATNEAVPTETGAIIESDFQQLRDEQSSSAKLDNKPKSDAQSETKPVESSTGIPKQTQDARDANDTVKSEQKKESKGKKSKSEN